MLLELQNVTKKFDGVVALSDVSFEVGQGEALGLIGPNGSGKTTVFNLISRLTDLDSGAIWLDGKPIHSILPSEIVGHGIGRVFQTPQLCSRLTILENVSMGTYWREHKLSKSFLWLHPPINVPEALAALRFVGIQEKSYELPTALSFLEQRKAELARALMSKPRLLLLDEVTSGFTTAERDAIEGTLRKLSEAGTTLFLIEHDLSLIRRLCKRIVVLEAGRKVCEGPPWFVEQAQSVKEIYMGAQGVVHQEPHN